MLRRILRGQTGEFGLPIVFLVTVTVLAVFTVALIPIVGNLTENVAKTNLEGSGYAVFGSEEYDDMVLDLNMVDQSLHSHEVWLSKYGDQSGGNWCDHNNLVPFVAVSGNNTWSDNNDTDTARILGQVDWEEGWGAVSVDFNKILIVGNTSSTVYRLRVVWGTGTIAEAISNLQYSESMYMRESVLDLRATLTLNMPRVTVGNNIWIQCWNATNDATLSFFVGAHPYFEEGVSPREP